MLQSLDLLLRSLLHSLALDRVLNSFQSRLRLRHEVIERALRGLAERAYLRA